MIYPDMAQWCGEMWMEESFTETFTVTICDYHFHAIYIGTPTRWSIHNLQILITP